MPFQFAIGDIVTHSGMAASRLLTTTEEGPGGVVKTITRSLGRQRLFVVARRAQPAGESTANVYTLRPILETETQQYIQGVGSESGYLEAYEHELMAHPDA